ncbi:flavodoxin family protein [bacterium]|nr:flavodoxin family protein [bacterium]
MRKVVALLASPRKKHTYEATRQFLDNVQACGQVECELVVLSDYQVGMCRGCKVCFEKGEEYCPLKDDRDVLIDKMMRADGVVFACPNYSFQVCALMKVFLDRLGFVFHRPRFFGKVFTALVTQGIYGGEKIVNYLDFVGNGFGFTTVKGRCFTAFEPMTEQEKQQRDQALTQLSQRFYRKLVKPEFPVPTFFKLMGFRMGRTSIRLELDETSRDYTYYRDLGWFDSDYYYPTRVGFIKRSLGKLFDTIQTRQTRNRKKSQSMPNRCV